MKVFAVDSSSTWCIRSRVVMNVCCCDHCQPWREPYTHRHWDWILWQLFQQTEAVKVIS